MLRKFVTIICCCLFAKADLIIKGNLTIPAEKIKLLVDNIFDIDGVKVALHESDLFEKVSVYSKDSNYVVEVEEKKIVSKIIFFVDGDAKTKEDLGPRYDALMQVTKLTLGMHIDSQKLLSAKTDIIRYYTIDDNRSYVQVETKIIPGANGTYEAHFVITRGPRYSINDVEFVGLKKLDKYELRKYFKSRIKNYVVFQTSSPEPLTTLENYSSLLVCAQNEGYLKAKIKTSFVETKNNTQTVYVVMEEGSQFKIRNVKINVDKSLHEEKTIKTITGVAYRYEINAYASHLVKTYKNNGQHVSVNCIEKFDGEFVDLEFVVAPIPVRYVISKILVKGNEKTRSSIVIRASGLSVGSYFDHKRLKQVEYNVMRLGFFDNVDVQHIEDEKNGGYIIVINAIDKRSGQVGLSGNMKIDSSSVEYSASLFYDMPNFMGKGETLILAATLGEIQENFMLAYRKPTLLNKKISNSWSIYKNDVITKSSKISKNPEIDSKYIDNSKEKFKSKLKDTGTSAGFKTNTLGFANSFGFDLFDYGSLKTFLSINREKITNLTFENDVNKSRFFSKELFSDERLCVKFGIGHAIDKTFHERQNISLHNTLSLNSDSSTSFIKFEPTFKAYYPCNLSQTIYMKSIVSYGHIYSLSKRHNWLDNFPGEEASVKGIYGISPTERNRYSSLGGIQKFSVHAELIMPFILPPTWNFNAFAGIYCGSVWNANMGQKVVLKQYAEYRGWRDDVPDVASDEFHLRSSASAGFRWNLGPFLLEWSLNLIIAENKETDTSKVFEFKLTL